MQGDQAVAGGLQAGDRSRPNTLQRARGKRELLESRSADAGRAWTDPGACGSSHGHEEFGDGSRRSFYPGRREVIDAGRDCERMQDYIVGRLSDDEHRAFEDRLVRDPGLVHELEQSLRLSEGLHQLRAQGHYDKAASRARGSRIWLPILAAAAIAGLALFLWLQPHNRPSPVLTASLESRTTGVAPSVAAHFTFVAVRSSSTPDLQLPSGGVIEFRAAPATHMTPSRYRMTLVQQ